MKNKKKIIVSIVAVVLLLVCAVGATLAWFTDSAENVTNTFTVGNVDIILYETNEDTIAKQLTKEDAAAQNEAYSKWLEDELGNREAGQPGFGVNMVPGYTVDKNVFIENIASVDALIGATFTVPTAIKDEIIVTVGNSWQLVNTYEEGANTEFVYVYTKVLDTEEQADVFIQSVGINSAATNEGLNNFYSRVATVGAEKTFDIVVNAYAIQQPIVLDVESLDVEALDKAVVAEALAKANFAGVTFVAAP